MDKKRKLNSLLERTLSPLINSNYIYLDLPYYTNIGDTLIWKGTEDFLSTLDHRCLYRSSIETYHKPEIDSDTIILFQGGGNFGDIWRRHPQFIIRVLNDFPNNRAIILPQTIFYKDMEILKEDGALFSRYPDLTICCRDKISHQLIIDNFPKNRAIMLPDMAFCIQKEFLKQHTTDSKAEQLFFKREDRELSEFDYNPFFTHNNIKQHEWPSMDHKLYLTVKLDILIFILRVFKKIGINSRALCSYIDNFATKVYMPKLLKIGICFISRYNYIYTTRLHGAILSVLLNRPITFFDNSYGKNSSFYDTWLKDYESIKFIYNK